MTSDVSIKVVNKGPNSLPSYATDGSAGVDVKAVEDLMVNPGDVVMMHTGLYMAIPKGYEIQVRPRSGLAYKHGITVINSPGTIDSDYRGECNVLLHNTSKNTFRVNKGDRIAQFVLGKVYTIKWDAVDSLDETDRGEGGFGSTGKSSKVPKEAVEKLLAIMKEEDKKYPIKGKVNNSKVYKPSETRNLIKDFIEILKGTNEKY